MAGPAEQPSAYPFMRPVSELEFGDVIRIPSRDPVEEPDIFRVIQYISQSGISSMGADLQHKSDGSGFEERAIVTGSSESFTRDAYEVVGHLGRDAIVSAEAWYWSQEGEVELSEAILAALVRVIEEREVTFRQNQPR